MSRKKVIIIGGGFAGLNAAKRLRHADCDLLVIDKTNHHLFQPLLYEVATAALSPGEIATPLREILRHQENTSVIMGEVTAIDKVNKTVTIANGETHSFDALVIAVGAHHSYFGNDQWEPLAPGLKTINDAIEIRQQILISFEKAERMDSIAAAEKFLNFVIIGGGPTGVEMAGAIAEIAYKTMFKNFRRIKPEEANIYLIEALPHILPAFPEKLGLRAKSDLERMGVHVMTGQKVTNITEDGVQTEDRLFPAKNIIWAAGNQTGALLKKLDVMQDRQGRVFVEPDLSIPGHEDIFVIGDAAHLKGKNDKPLPGIAPVAIQMGKYVGKVLKQERSKAQRKPFRYWDKGSLATIGKLKAVGVIGKFQVTGFWAWNIWAFIHILYLVGHRDRFGVMLEWAAVMLTGQRGVRIITRPIDHELPKLP